MQKQFLYRDSYILKKEVKEEFSFIENLAEETTFEEGNQWAVQGRGLLPDIVCQVLFACLIFD